MKTAYLSLTLLRISPALALFAATGLVRAAEGNAPTAPAMPNHHHQRWKDKWWLIVDGRGLRVYTSDNGIDGFQYNMTILGERDGTRPHDGSVGHHPGIVIQGPSDNQQCLVYYFTESNRHAYLQLAELELSADGKAFCNRNKYAPATQPGE